MKATFKSVANLVLAMVLLTAAQLHAGDGTHGRAMDARAPLRPPVNLTLVKKCCIAGTYEGTHVQKSLSNGKPGKNVSTSFTMVIQQFTCGSSFTGTITDADGAVMTMQGTVSGSGACCKISGQAWKVSSLKLFSGAKGPKTDNERIRLQGTFCRSNGQWVCLDGVSLNLENGSKGRFTLSQI